MKKNSLFFLLLFPLGYVAQSQTVDEIVNKNIEARGGLDKLKALQSIILEGSMNQGGADVIMKFYAVNNKGSKVEFSVNGQTGYNIVTPKEGWTFNPFAGNTSAEPLPEAQLNDSQQQLDLPGPLVDYKAKGNKVEYTGKDTVQGVEYYKLKITRPGGRVTTYYLDKNYLITKSITTMNVGGSDREITTEYSDYRKTPEGYTFPYKRITPNGEIVFDKIEVNPKIDDSVFKPSN